MVELTDHPQQQPQLHRGPSKSRPSLAGSALLDGVSFEDDLVSRFIPLKPMSMMGKKKGEGKREGEVDEGVEGKGRVEGGGESREDVERGDPYEKLEEVVGREVLIDVEDGGDGGSGKRSSLKMKKVPSFPFQGLEEDGVGEGAGEGKKESVGSVRGVAGRNPGVEGGGGGGGVTIPGATGAEGVSTSGSSLYPHSTSNDGGGGGSSGNSSAWSTLSNRLFSDNAPDTLTSTHLTPGSFTKEYDKLARKHGLQPFPAGHMVEPSSVSVSSVSVKRQSSEEMATVVIPHGPIGKGARILNRLLKRTESTKDVSERSRRTLGHPLGLKRMSVSDLAGMGRGRGKKDHLRGLHLEDMVRLSGVCEFRLPEKMAPGRLLVPACFHATGMYILGNGLTSPSLFRVAGSPAATEALYDYYQRQLGNSNGDVILQTTSLATLPTHLTYTVNDVAHLFKALLAGLPGGLLGSPAVFQALYSIQSFLHPDPSLDPRIARKIRPRMIALAIATLNLHFRITLICAVFGLLRCVALSTHGVIEESKITRPAEAFTYLKEDSLGVIFGPLLLGDKSDQILLPAHEERGGLLVLPTVAPQPDSEPTKGKIKQKKNQGYVQMQREKARRAALVTEMVIAEWEGVVVEMRKLGVLEVTRREYDIPGLESEEGSEVGGAVELQSQTRPGSRPRSEGKLKKRKSGMESLKMGSRDKLRPSSRTGSRPGERNDDPSSLLSPEPTEKKHHHLHIPNSQSVKHMKTNLQRTKSKAGDLLHFPSGTHRHKFSKAADMKTAMLPTSLIAEQDMEVDLMETDPQGVAGVGSSGVDDLSSLDIGRVWEEERFAQSLHEREHILAQEVLREAKTPVALVPLGMVASTDSEDANLVDRGGVKETTAETQGRRDSRSGQLLESSRFVYPLPQSAVEQSKKLVDGESLLEDPDLGSLLEVESDRAMVRQSPELVTQQEVVVPGTVVVEEESSRLGLPKSRPELRVTTQQQGSSLSDAPVSPAPALTLTTPGGKGIEIPKTGGRGKVHTREGSDTHPPPVSLEPIQISSPSAEEGDGWVTPPLGDVTPRPGTAQAQVQVLSEVEGDTEVEQKLEEEGSAIERDVDLEDSYSFTTTTPAPPTAGPQRNFSQRSVSSTYPYPRISPPLPSTTPSVLPLEIRSNSALYSEIHRLRGLLEKKTEEAERVGRELEIARRMVSAESAGMLGQLLREAREEGRVWRNRAEWAERRVREFMGEKFGGGGSAGGGGQVDGPGAGVRGFRSGEVSEARGGYGGGNGQLDGYGSAPEGMWRSRAGEVGMVDMGRGRGRGRMIGGEVAQRVGSWGVGLEVLGGAKNPGGSTTTASGRGRESQVVTVGPNGPLGAQAGRAKYSSRG